ncbi:MAG: hypothetical protein M9887_08080 [Chitinophagales bacterium]|nr:hypothetical protein [Chitinophagales bacterium]
MAEQTACHRHKKQSYLLYNDVQLCVSANLYPHNEYHLYENNHVQMLLLLGIQTTITKIEQKFFSDELTYKRK